VTRLALVLLLALCAMGACEPVPEERVVDEEVLRELYEHEPVAACVDLAGNRVPCSPPAEGVRL
jgi:hypothetical protein